MRALALALALLSVAPVAHGFSLWGSERDPLLKSRELFENRQYQEVILALTPAAMQKLKGRHLRQAYAYLGESHEKLGQLDKALGVYQVGAKLFPKHTQLLTHLAQLLHSAGLEEQALPLYERILNIQPENPNAHLGLAEIDRVLGFLDRSAEHYEKALESMGERAAVWRNYAEALYGRRDYRAAESAIRKSLKLSAEPETYVDLALIQRDSGDIAAAIATIEMIPQTASEDNLALARALWLFEAGQHERARAAVEDILKTSRQPLAFYIRARLNLGDGRKDLALADLRQAATGGKSAPFTARVAAELATRLNAP